MASARSDKTFLPIPKLRRDSSGQYVPQSFKRLIQYYRAEGLPATGGLSVETDSDEKRVNSNQPKPQQYRIDLSGGKYLQP
jgi:hypothetical protein